MIHQGLKFFIFIGALCVFVVLSGVAQINAAKLPQTNRLSLKSCDITITADRAMTHAKGVTYSGNVKILLGFAHLRVDEVTLIKKDNGQCELIAS